MTQTIFMMNEYVTSPIELLSEQLPRKEDTENEGRVLATLSERPSVDDIRTALEDMPADPFVVHDLRRKEWEEGPIYPTFAQFVVFCTCVIVGVCFGVTALIMVWFSGFDTLSSIAVYFAVANALILGAAVMFALLCSETYDTD